MYCPVCGHQNDRGADACGRCLASLTRLDEPAPHDHIERSLMTEPVSVLAPREPVTVSADADLGRALGEMIGQGVGAVLVVGSVGELVGILTERDFLAKAAGRSGFAGLPVREFMTPAPETVLPSDTLAFALGKMDAGSYRHLPVVDRGRPVGVISVRDILRHVTGLC